MTILGRVGAWYKAHLVVAREDGARGDPLGPVGGARALGAR